MPSNLFYILDLIIGFASPVLFLVLYRLNVISRQSWRIFWLGAAIGLTWEIPMFVGSYETTTLATLTTITPYPFHYAVFMILHTLWDGGLFYFNGHPITLFPQLVWFYGSLLFYFLVLHFIPQKNPERN